MFGNKCYDAGVEKDMPHENSPQNSPNTAAESEYTGEKEHRPRPRILTVPKVIWATGLGVALLPLGMKTFHSIVPNADQNYYELALYNAFTRGSVLWIGIALLATSFIHAPLKQINLVGRDLIHYASAMAVSALLLLGAMPMYVGMSIRGTHDLRMSMVLSLLFLFVFVFLSWRFKVLSAK